MKAQSLHRRPKLTLLRRFELTPERNPDFELGFDLLEWVWSVASACTPGSFTATGARWTLEQRAVCREVGGPGRSFGKG